MNAMSIKVIALAAGCAFSVAATAESISKEDYKAGKEKIEAAYKAEKAACSGFSDNRKDICIVQAKGTEKVSRAELEAVYKPDSRSRHDVLVAKAEAGYAVAKERCDDLAGNAKDVCVTEAKAAETAAKAEAKAQMKTSDANAKASEKSAEARVEATKDKTDAGYEVEKEKCDTFAGAVKDQCLDKAKQRFGKS